MSARSEDTGHNLLSVSGTCFCKKVTVNVRGKPTASSICHCSICRSLTGSAFSVQSLHRAENFQCNTKEDALWGIDTSKQVRRFRCRDCGSPVYASLGKGKTFAVPRSILYKSDDERQLEIVKKFFNPSHHMYYSDRCIDMNDSLPKFVGTSFPGKSVVWKGD